MVAVWPEDPRDAFARQILAEHGKYLRRFLIRRGVPERDADDVLQEVVKAACDARDTYDPSRDLRAWLLGIAANQVTLYLRRPHVQREQLTLTDEASTVPDDEHPNPEEVMIQRDRLGMLDQMVESMPSLQREVFISYKVDEIPMPEVANAQGLSLARAWNLCKAGSSRCLDWFHRWQAAERARGRDGIPLVLVPLFEETQSARRAVARRRLAGLAGRAAIALLALGCMSPPSSRVAPVEPLALGKLAALGMALAERLTPAHPAPATSTPAPPRAESAPAPPPRSAARRRGDEDDILVLQAEAEHAAGNDAEAIGLILERTGDDSKRCTRLLRKVDGLD